MFKRVYSRLSLQQKIVGIALATTSIGLSIALLVLLGGELSSTWNERREYSASLGRVVGLNSTAALSFHDPDSATETLSSLAHEPNVIAAFLVDTDNVLFARYESESPLHQNELKEIRHTFAYLRDTDTVDESIELGSLFHLKALSRFHVRQPVVYKGKQLGELNVFFDLTDLVNLAKKRSLTAIMALFIVFVITWLLAARLQRMVSAPVHELANRMALVSATGDYSTHVPRTSNDEIGTLMDSFNTMIDQIRVRDEELVRAKEEAEMASRAKSLFVANMSHEIRNPMNSIIGMTDLLVKTPLSPQQNHYATIVKSSAAALLGIINDILDFSKIEAGKIQLEQIPFRLRELVAGVIALFDDAAASRTISLKYLIDSSVPDHLVGDPLRLRQILINLLSNGLKFTERGMVFLNISCDHPDDPLPMFCFEVQDTGIGISQEKLDLIFEHFSQADNSTTRRFGGTGLGLAIVRQLVDLMEGTIVVNSAPGVGSTFRCSLPIRRQPSDTLHSQQPEPVDSFLDLPTGTGADILIVEDLLPNQEVCREFLKCLGHRYYCAMDGLEALNIMTSRHFDLIFMDCQMPHQDGYETTRRYREWEAQQPDTPHIPIIALSGNIMDSDLRHGHESGMDGCLCKPFTFQQFSDTVRQYVKKAPGV